MSGKTEYKNMPGKYESKHVIIDQIDTCQERQNINIPGK